jgi:hypothetical protein
VRKDMQDRPRNASRRKLLQAAIVGATALTLRSTSSIEAHEKMSQHEAQYQDSPKDIWTCAVCALFEPPNSCKVVEGVVNPDGWCKAFALAD